MAKSDKNKIPYHLAIIPDGNRRWSKKNKIPLSKGYVEGAIQVENIMRASFNKGIKYFTIWGASEDNLKKRNGVEIKILSHLLKRELRKWLSSKDVFEKQIRMHIVGNGVKILKNKELEKLAKEVEEKTKKFSKHHFTLLFGYDGKTEMIDAIEKIRNSRSKKINYESVKKNLETSHLPPVNLVIRTGGEPHWSAGFLMWHTCDSEFYFPEVFWPAFDKKELEKALKDYSKRRSLKGK